MNESGMITSSQQLNSP